MRAIKHTAHSTHIQYTVLLNNGIYTSTRMSKHGFIVATPYVTVIHSYIYQTTSYLQIDTKLDTSGSTPGYKSTTSARQQCGEKGQRAGRRAHLIGALQKLHRRFSINQ